MPLIVMTGTPCSGKTTRTNEIKKYFEAQGKTVHIISEEEQIVKAGFEKNSFYLDSSKEKHIRGLLKSDVLKLIGPNSIVILDGSNYIKGYRYELYCASKANKSTQCTIYTLINHDVAWEFNGKRDVESEKYNRETFDALIMRYEEPDSKNRWDSPLFMVYPDSTLEFSEISGSLFEKNPPAPNQSTQNPPLSATNFLYELDKITKEITDQIIKAKSSGAVGEFQIPGYDNLTIDISSITKAQLIIARRQYLVYSKMHAPAINQIAQLYIQFLKTSIS